MFAVGLVLTTATAVVAGNERRARAELQVANEELHASTERVAELSATAERNRLARDIHDGLGHHLTAITVLLQKAAAFRDRDASAADRAVEDARESARLALEDIRRSVHALRDEPFRLARELGELARQADDGRLVVTVDSSGDESHYPAATLMALFRVAQEGITNVRRHACATRASVTVQCAQSQASLVVVDDGDGFSTDHEGFGLRGIRERVALVGGTVDVDSRPGGGTRLAVAIPRAAPP
jgi:signal transduction histidine kinase